MLLKILSTITDKIKKTLITRIQILKRKQLKKKQCVIQGRFHLYNYCSVLKKDQLVIIQSRDAH